jgi:hypothetical protein
MQPTTCRQQPTCNRQHATDSMQATCNMQHATDSMQATCNMQPTTCRQHATCNRQHATDNMQATDDRQHAGNQLSHSTVRDKRGWASGRSIGARMFSVHASRPPTRLWVAETKNHLARSCKWWLAVRCISEHSRVPARKLPSPPPSPPSPSVRSSAERYASLWYKVHRMLQRPDSAVDGRSALHA